MGVREAKTFCRICPGYCGLILSINEDDRVIKIRGDHENPMSQGYACLKGLDSAHLYHGPQRLLNPLKRMPDGTYVKIGLEDALDEIAEKLKRIIERNGPDAVALFKGGNTFLSPLPSEFMTGFMKAIGTSSLFTNNTIDQSAKAVSADRLGSWNAGKGQVGSVDTMVIFGGNPLVSIVMYGFDPSNPTKKLKEFKARGGKLVVIDPRYTETARFADVFIQPRPGEDFTIAAGMLRLILAEGWEDKAFCVKYVDQIEKLRQAVEPFTLDYVAQRADIPAHKLREATELYVKAKRAFALTGTGPNMSPRSNLTQHLIDCLDVVRGNFLREGDPVPNPGTQGQPPRYAQVNPPGRCWEKSPKSRIRGLGLLFGEKMTGVMAEEITTPGPGQIRALIVDGANPAAAVPDQKRIVDAMLSLELMVTIDPELSNTARVAHYVLPPKLQFEHPTVNGILESEAIFFPRPAQQYAAPAIPCPPGAELVDDWYVFWSLAKRLGHQLYFQDVPLDMTKKPDDDYLLSLLFRNGPVSLEDIKKFPSGHIFDDVIRAVVQPASPDAKGKFEVAPPDVLSDIAEVAAEKFDVVQRAESGESFDLLLISRRLRDIFNSAGRSSPVIRKRTPYNAAYLHPDEIAVRDLVSGDYIDITSDNGSIRAIVKADEALRSGVLSMAHGWGGLPDDQQGFETDGASTNLLISSVRDCEKINAMPRQSAIPIYISKVNPA